MKRVLVGLIILLIIFSFFSVYFFFYLFERENIPPQAVLTATGTFVDVNEEVIFSANQSVDKDGEIVRYYWDFGDYTNDTKKYVEHHYEEGGNYTVILIITDDDGEKALQTITIHVNDLPKPVIDIELPAYIHEPVYFYANKSRDQDGYIKEYLWDFGDGSNGTGMSTYNVYSEKDRFQVILTVRDNDDALATTSMQFNISFREYSVEWETEWVEVDIVPGNLNEENSTYFSSRLSVLNMTKVLFNLTWTDEQPYVGSPPITEPQPNDKFILNVTSPDEQYYEKGGIASEKILLYAPEKGQINPIPDSFIIEAESEDILADMLAQDYTTNLGIGDWDINITCEYAHGALGTPDLDPGEDWDYVASCQYYYPKFTMLD
jgi:PKD repeat protein